MSSYTIHSFLRYCIILTFLLLISNTAWAQPTNDDCLSAINIPSVDNYCSGNMEFTNINATPDTPSQQAIDECVSPSFENGVWFTFRPRETAVLIGVNSGTPFGTIANIRAVLYTGSCTTGLEYVSCSPGNASLLELTQTDLTVGQRYYFYVESNQPGSFQLCINDFIAPPSPQSDCDNAVVLCNTDAFVVAGLTTAGNDPNELDGFTDRCISQEFQSAWYKWTCDESGSLTFTLTPNNFTRGLESDDLDFAVFELPNGIDDCDAKEMVLCMASGETGGCDFSIWNVCNGPTGLRDSSVDTEEFPGCDQCTGGNDDNFIAPLMMVSGRSYALVVMNFNRSGQGFGIDFGGTGTFLGPAPDFSEVLGNFIECDKTVEYIDNSDPGPDPIEDWFWNFGEDAVPQTATGIGPHETTYESFGPKSVTLTVRSMQGCEVTTIEDLFVEPCCLDFDLLEVDFTFSDPLCPGDDDGSFTLQGLNGSPEFNYSIDGGEFTPNPNFNNLPPGEYFVQVVDQKGCETDTVILIEEPDPIEVSAGFDIEIDLGFSDTLDATIVPSNANVTYMWIPEEGLDCPDSDFVDCPDPIVVSPGTTTYTVIITDERGCTAEDQVQVVTNIVRPIFQPNVITPDSQDENSIFVLGFGRQVERVTRFSIYDRWGGLIYTDVDIGINQDNQMERGWNGRFGAGLGQSSALQVNPGVFAWFAEVLFIDGVTIAFSGDLTVLK